MRHAMLALGVALAALLALAGDARTQADTPIMNAVGLVDYTRKPDFKIGSWARYHVTGNSNLGAKDDYVVTILIAGEERFWGEDAFWVETQTQPRSGPSRTVATLMSYEIFSDSLALPRMQFYMRKSITDVDEQGRPIQQLVKRPAPSLRVRTALGENVRWSVEKLPSDTALVPRGTYTCDRSIIKQGMGATGDQGDSSVYTETRENRTIWYHAGIPITHIVREEIERSFARRAWQIGRSSEGLPMQMIEDATGSARLVDFGEGMKPAVVPLRWDESSSASISRSRPAMRSRSVAAAWRRSMTASA